LRRERRSSVNRRLSLRWFEPNTHHLPPATTCVDGP
jgi:hypothetical protein